MRDVVSNVNNVTSFCEEAAKKHPNRFDLCKMDGTKSVDEVRQGSQSQAPGGFGSGTNPFTQPSTSSGFGQPSGFGRNLGFGQPSAPGGTSTFGKPSQPGTFGQPSFGQPSAPSQTPAFGQPSQPAQPSTFGQPSQPISFGQTGFGQPSQPSAPNNNPFATGPSNLGSSNAPGFGQPSAPTAAFGKPSFGAATSSGQNASPFGQPSTSSGFGQTGFGQPSVPQPTTSASTNPFSQQTSSQSNPFASNNSSTPFGSTNNQPSAASGGFGSQPATTPGISTGAPHPLTGKPAVPMTYTQTLPNIPSTTRQVTDPITKKPKTILVTYKGCKVEYKDDKPCYERPDGKGYERIFFPEGEPPVKKDDVEPAQSMYTDEV